MRVEFRQRRRPRRDAVPVANAIPQSVPPDIAGAFRQAIGFTAFSAFQARAIDQVYACARQGNPQNESFIISGDTGAGKTEAFLFPILLDIASEPPEVREQPGVRAVLVYPRIRLARNQLGRLLRYTGRFHAAGGPRITVGIQNGDVPRDLGGLAEKWPVEKRQGRDWHQVGLLETCAECDGGHYWLAADDPAIESGCPRLVCDRCGHVVDTLHVTQAALDCQRARHPDHHRCLAQPMAGAREVHAPVGPLARGHHHPAAPLPGAGRSPSLRAAQGRAHRPPDQTLPGSRPAGLHAERRADTPSGGDRRLGHAARRAPLPGQADGCGPAGQGPLRAVAR